MRVLCIDDKPRHNDWPDSIYPEAGRVYTAVGEEDGVMIDGQIVPCYLIPELDPTLDYISEKDRFIDWTGVESAKYVTEKVKEFVIFD